MRYIDVDESIIKSISGGSCNYLSNSKASNNKCLEEGDMACIQVRSNTFHVSLLSFFCSQTIVDAHCFIIMQVYTVLK
jgi:hypothetical protein